MTTLYLRLFYTFFKIGLFGFGGGYGMLSLIQAEVVENSEWITTQQFTDIVAISQMTPGPIGINSATFVGYTAVENATSSTLFAIFGSLIASTAVMLPSFIIMLCVSSYFLRYKNHPLVHTILSSLRYVVVGLLMAAVVSMLSVENLGSPSEDIWQFVISLLLLVASFIATVRYKVNPIKVILLSGVVGGVVYSII